MKTIFFDSSFIIAYALEEDENHEKAVKLVHENNYFSDYLCCISNYIISEVITVVGQKAGISLVKYTYEILKDNFKVLNEYEIFMFNEEFMSIYLQNNAELSFVDSSVVKMVDYFNIDYLISYDKYLNKIVREKKFC